MRDINKIILHCSATRDGQDISTETIRGWHVNERGWSDIGYHFVVLLDGTVDKARPVERQGAHVRGKNKGSIGVCYIGGCDADMNPKDTRNEAQKKSLEELISYLMEAYDDATLHGHNEFSSKACPSFNVKEEYKELIECYE
jgi:N-acetylmuramoyl-L-alanine amidase|tara:strand:+ start:628 stop:1053 length:426 start_codon:yes stop_codon:yes gene_type:complete